MVAPAHEINQPIGATLNNASAALRWLDKEPPDLEQARQALNRIFANGNRVSCSSGKSGGKSGNWLAG